MLKRTCIQCGDNVRIGTNVRILNWHGLKVGSNVSVHDNCYLYVNGSMSISDNVSIADTANILFFKHNWSDNDVPIKCNFTKLL